MGGGGGKRGGEREREPETDTKRHRETKTKSTLVSNYHNQNATTSAAITPELCHSLFLAY